MSDDSKTMRTVWTAVGVLVLIGVVLWVASRLWSAIAPFLLGVALYVILKPLAEWLRRRGLSDVRAAAVAATVGFVSLLLVSVALAPLVLRQATAMVAGAPAVFKGASDIVSHTLETGSIGRFRIPESALPYVREEFDSVVTWSIDALREGGVVAIEGAAKAGEWLLYVLLAFIVAYWLMRDASRLRAELVKVSAGRGRQVDHAIGTASRVSSGYLRGQALACGSTSVMVGVLLTLIGVPYALVIAVATFFLDFVPYLGATVSALLAVLAGAFGNRLGLSPVASAALAGALVVVSRWMTDIFVIPKVMSREVNIHPLIVIGSLLVGATTFGAIGLVLAIPTAGILQGMVVYWWETKTGETLVSQDGALFRSCPPGEGEAPEPTGVV